MELIRKLIRKWRAKGLRQPDKSAGDTDIGAKADLVPVVTMRVFRAATQTWEDV